MRMLFKYHMRHLPSPKRYESLSEIQDKFNYQIPTVTNILPLPWHMTFKIIRKKCMFLFHNGIDSLGTMIIERHKIWAMANSIIESSRDIWPFPNHITISYRGRSYDNTNMNNQNVRSLRSELIKKKLYHITVFSCRIISLQHWQKLFSFDRMTWGIEQEAAIKFLQRQSQGGIPWTWQISLSSWNQIL